MGAEAEERPAWFTAYLESLNIKREEVQMCRQEIFKKNKSPSHSRPQTRQKQSNRSEKSPPHKFKPPFPLLILKVLLMELLYSWFDLLSMLLSRLKRLKE